MADSVKTHCLTEQHQQRPLPAALITDISVNVLIHFGGFFAILIVSAPAPFLGAHHKQRMPTIVNSVRADEHKTGAALRVNRRGKDKAEDRPL